MKVFIVKRAVIITLALLVTAASGCAAVAYNSLRYNRELECQKLQGAADRQECSQKAGISYEEYQRQLNKQPPP